MSLFETFSQLNREMQENESLILRFEWAVLHLKKKNADKQHVMDEMLRAAKQSQQNTYSGRLAEQETILRATKFDSISSVISGLNGSEFGFQDILDRSPGSSLNTITWVLGRLCNQKKVEHVRRGVYRNVLAAVFLFVMSLMLSVQGMTTNEMAAMMPLTNAPATNEIDDIVTLAWNLNPNPYVAGYDIYYGSASGHYTNKTSCGTNTLLSITNMAAGYTWYFAGTTYSAEGAESVLSAEVSLPIYLYTLTNTTVTIWNGTNALFTTNNPRGNVFFVLSNGVLVHPPTNFVWHPHGTNLVNLRATVNYQWQRTP